MLYKNNETLDVINTYDQETKEKMTKERKEAKTKRFISLDWKIVPKKKAFALKNRTSGYCVPENSLILVKQNALKSQGILELADRADALFILMDQCEDMSLIMMLEFLFLPEERLIWARPMRVNRKSCMVACIAKPGHSFMRAYLLVAERKFNCLEEILLKLVTYDYPRLYMVDLK